MVLGWEAVLGREAIMPETGLDRRCCQDEEEKINIGKPFIINDCGES